jgi:hypothetical protein
VDMIVLWWPVEILLFFSSKRGIHTVRRESETLYEVRGFHGSDNEGNSVLRNVSKHFPDYTVS